MSRLKSPLVIVVCLICLALGVSSGVGTMLALGYQPPPKPVKISVVEKNTKGKKAKARREKFWRSFRRLRLISLVARLDLLTSKAPQLQLSAEEQAKLADNLKDLDQIKELKPEDYTQRYEAIVGVLQKHEGVLKTAGFRPPGEKFSWPAETPNPFVAGESKKHLQSLRKRFPPKS